MGETYPFNDMFSGIYLMTCFRVGKCGNIFIRKMAEDFTFYGTWSKYVFGMCSGGVIFRNIIYKIWKNTPLFNDMFWVYVAVGNFRFIHSKKWCYTSALLCVRDWNRGDWFFWSIVIQMMTNLWINHHPNDDEFVGQIVTQMSLNSWINRNPNDDEFVNIKPTRYQNGYPK